MRGVQLTDTGRVLEIYWSKSELETADIVELFSGISRTSAAKLKNVARKVMAEQNVKSWSSTGVVTEIAFNAWGIDINKLEQRYKKLQKLKSQKVS